MQNPLKRIQEQRRQEAAREELRQAQRKERLRQLEEKHNQKGFHLSNPFQTMKDKKEMKELRRDIETYEEQVKSSRNISHLLPVLILMVIGPILLLVIVTVIKNGSKDTNTTSMNTEVVVNITTETESNTTIAENNTEDLSIIAEADEPTENSVISQSSEETELETSLQATESSVNTDFVSDDTNTDEKSVAENDIIPISNETDQLDYTIISIDDLSVYHEREYAHATDSIRLGTNECLFVTITTANNQLTIDDLYFDYDENLLSVEIDAPQIINNNTQIKIRIHGKTIGISDFLIFTVYDLLTKGEEATGAWLNIIQMDPSDGRIVYATSSGTYHYSRDCAGGECRYNNII